MAPLDSETSDWIAKCDQGEEPYAMIYFNGVRVISLVRDEDWQIQRVVGQEGHACWRAINESKRNRKLRFEATASGGKVEWTGNNKYIVDTSKVSVEERIMREGGKRTLSVKFIAKDVGHESIVTECKGCPDLLTSNFTINPKSGGVNMQRDWLGAVAEMAKGLPGGQIVLGPLIKLREQEKSAVRDAQAASRHQEVQALLEKNQTIDEQTLERTLKLDGDIREVKMTLEVLAPLLREVQQSWHQGRELRPALLVLQAQQRVTRFPIPIDRSLLVEELDALFPTDMAQTTFKDVLVKVGWQKLPRTESSTLYFNEFTHSLAGQSQEKLARVFSLLHEERPASQILQFAAEYLSGKTTDDRTS
jgi:hypothetical protein